MCADAAEQRYGTIVIVGGGCYGSYYVRQLERAASAGALGFERLVVVDRDPACRVARETHAIEPDLVIAEWGEYFDRYFAEAASAGESAARDAIVPSPLMPHLMPQWLRRRAERRWPGRRVEARPLAREPSVPWQRSDGGGTHYVSFAEWMCPVNCVEPALCPVIRGPRTWSMPPAVRAYVEAERARGHPLAGPAIFHCRHRAYGVGMFDTRDVLAADATLAALGEAGAVEMLVATVSHCHGALTLLSVSST